MNGCRRLRVRAGVYDKGDLLAGYKTGVNAPGRDIGQTGYGKAAIGEPHFPQYGIEINGDLRRRIGGDDRAREGARDQLSGCERRDYLFRGTRPPPRKRLGLRFITDDSSCIDVSRCLIHIWTVVGQHTTAFAPKLADAVLFLFTAVSCGQHCLCVY